MHKEHILQELKRIAAAKGGKPLGSQRFESETGIKQSGWKGKFLDRWGDALQEAGFAPNQFQGSYDEAELLEKYAILARRLDKLPTNPELHLEAHILGTATD